jgi:hypothetical protein
MSSQNGNRAGQGAGHSVGSTAAEAKASPVNTQAAPRSVHYTFGPAAIAVAKSIRAAGAIPNGESIALLAEIDRRFPTLSAHDLHGAAVLAQALALKTEGNA